MNTSDDCQLYHSKQETLDDPSGNVDSENLARDLSDQGGVSLKLSFAQERLWVLHHLEPQNTGHNLTLEIRFCGPLKLPVLQRSIAEIVKRHSILRTLFGLVDGEPVQLVQPFVRLIFGVTDCTTEENSEGWCVARTRATEYRRVPFDLSQGPLLRAELFRLSEECHVFLVIVHQILLDNRSLRIFQEELLRLYNAFSDGENSPLADLPLQYSDYCTWQRGVLREERFQAQSKYWQSEMAEPPVLALPTDRPRPAVWRCEGGSCFTALTPAVSRNLEEFGQKEGVTIFMIILTVFSLLLARYCRQDDVVIGCPVTGRTQREFEPLIGVFANTLPLRIRLTDDPTVRELLGRVRRTVLAGLSNQEIPLEVTVEALRADRDTSRAPLFQATLDMVDFSEPSNELTSLFLERGSEADITVRHDLALQVTRSGSAIQFVLAYATSLFDHDSVRGFLETMKTLLESMLSSPNEKALQIPILAQTEQQEIVRKWNKTATDYPKHETFVHLVDQSFRRFPTDVAVRFDASGISYSVLQKQVTRLVRHLLKMGLTPGEPVAIYLPRSPAIVVSILAIARIGAMYVPLDAGYPVARIAYMLADSGARIVISDQELVPLPFSFDGELVDISAIIAAAQSDPLTEVETLATSERSAYIIYTSGSTGRPKGVVIPHRAVTNLLVGMGKTLDLSSGDRWLAVAPISFDMSVLEILLPLTLGAQIVLATAAEVADGPALAELIRSTGATVVQATPSMWRMLLDAEWNGSKQVHALCGGEPMPADIAVRLLGRAKSVWNLYGPTETTVWSSVFRVEDETYPVPIGRPIQNTRFFILDQNLALVPIGAIGELCIGGEGLATGYHHLDEQTKAKFVLFTNKSGGTERIYRTGDLAYYRWDGLVFLIGRADDQVKLRGHRIELHEIESHLIGSGLVQDAVAIVREDTPGDARLIAYVVPLTADRLVERLTAHLVLFLPRYMIPNHIISLPALPRHPSGKVDRTNLPDPVAVSRCEEPEQKTALEESIAGIWRTVLNLKEVHRTDNFFDLGGHSLLLVRVQMGIERALGSKISNIELLRHPTIESLASLLAKEEMSAESRDEDEGRAYKQHMGFRVFRSRLKP